MISHNGKTVAATTPTVRKGSPQSPFFTETTRAQRDAIRKMHEHPSWDNRGCADAEAFDLPPKRIVRGRYATEAARKERDDEYAVIVDERRAICRACPIYYDCHDYALTRPDVTGVLAGFTDEERAAWPERGRTA